MQWNLLVNWGTRNWWLGLALCVNSAFAFAGADQRLSTAELSGYRAAYFGVCKAPGTVACPPTCVPHTCKFVASGCLKKDDSPGSAGPNGGGFYGVCGWSILPYSSCLLSGACGGTWQNPSCPDPNADGNCVGDCANAGAYKKCP